MSEESKESIFEKIKKTISFKDLKDITKIENDIDWSEAKSRDDLIRIFIDNGLHLKYKDNLLTVKEKPPAPISRSIPVLVDVVMSIIIMGHGCEHFTRPWTKTEPFSEYFRNNVRVYSRACVPDVNAIGSIIENIDIIRDVRGRFSSAPNNETAAIISTYADAVKMEYIKDIAFNKLTETDLSKTTGFAKVSSMENMTRVSGLSTYLCNKDFNFSRDTREEEIEKSFGIHVIDIRLKKTAMDGSISYEQIFTPNDPTFENIINFNLIYRRGITYILKDVLKREDLINQALEIFGFTDGIEKIMDVSLEQMYAFFKLLKVEYANIMDYTCRDCVVDIDPNLAEKIYRIEQKYSVKPINFGGLKKNKSVNKRNKNKRNKNKRTKNKRNKNKRYKNY
jgi:hypothetical protein